MPPGGLNNEHRIVCKIMTEGDLRPILDRGVKPEWFYVPDHRDALKFILDHHDKYGVIPTKGTFVSHFGTGYKIVGVTESMEYLLDTCAEYNQWMHGKATALDVADSLNAKDTSDAIKRMEEGLAKIRSFTSARVTLVDSMDNDRLEKRWDDYLDRGTSSGLLGYATGFPTIDATTMGLQNGQLVTLIAQQKVGKTSLCLTMGNNIYAAEKQQILFVTFEMSVRELEMRQESLMAHVNFRNLQLGKLSKLEEARYDAWISMAEADYTWPFHFMDASHGATVSSIEAQAELHDPGVIFVDGIYMMTDEITGERNSWEAITNITRSLKRLAVRLDRPIVINSQALHSKSKGKKIGTESAGYSSSFGQDSDVILGLERITPGKGETDEDYAYDRMLRILDSRNSGTAEVPLLFDYESGWIKENL